MALIAANELLERIRNGERFVADGAMGSELIKQGVRSQNVIGSNAVWPEAAQTIHRGYLREGAQILTANTFGFIPVREFEDAVLRGVEIALDEAHTSERRVLVWASFPARGVVMYRDALARMTDELPEALLIETCTDMKETLTAMGILQELRPELLAVTCHFRGNKTMPDGTKAEIAAKQLTDAGADIVGANCGDNPTTFPALAELMRKAADTPLLFQPSAGIPNDVFEGFASYPFPASDWAKIGKRLFDAGANIVGGCCGTTPAHIAALAERMNRTGGTLLYSGRNPGRERPV